MVAAAVPMRTLASTKLRSIEVMAFTIGLMAIHSSQPIRNRIAPKIDRAGPTSAARSASIGRSSSPNAQGDQRGQCHESRRNEGRGNAARIDQAMTQFRIGAQVSSANRRPTPTLPPTE